MKKSKYLPVLAASVASGLSIKDASAIACCTESTAYSLSCTDDFKHEVNRIRTQAVEQAIAVLSNSATLASQTMVNLLSSSDEKTALAAAVKLLAMLGPLAELHELRARIDAIEKQGPGLRVAR